MIYKDSLFCRRDNNQQRKSHLCAKEMAPNYGLVLFLIHQSKIKAVKLIQKEIIMDFHTSGKGFFFSSTGEEEFWNPHLIHAKSYIKTETERLQHVYDSLASPYTASMELSCYPRERKAKIFVDGSFEDIILCGKKVKWKDNKGTKFRFLKTPLFTARGRYLKTDMIMFLAKLCKARTTRSISSCCLAFGINPSTCRGWAKKLLLMKGFVPSPGSFVWEDCADMLKDIDSEDAAIRFLSINTWEEGVFKNNDNPPIP